MKKLLGHRYACEQAHSFVSLRLDEELSQLEAALLDAHLGECADCRAYATSVTAATVELRAAPYERLARPIALPAGRRRVTLRRLQAAAATGTAAAAAMIGVVVGINAALPQQPRVEAAAPRFVEPVTPEQELRFRLRATRPEGRRGDDMAL